MEKAMFFPSRTFGYQSSLFQVLVLYSLSSDPHNLLVSIESWAAPKRGQYFDQERP
uniref:Uncharacterized protein n=1 Tax=Picea glauca TaxID=3330 RepID=A0A101M311_PICGL|nr:hypothetical protein ABT39_MTgene3202 [Picea glauca]QHR88476.1 hypothetical protein Q903MT_gene2490 [Picea sitchensis]